MSYTKQTWTDHVVDRPHTYTETVDSDGTKTLTAAGEVLQQGSPMSAERFNHIESGIEGAHTAVSNLETTTNTALSGKVDKVTGKGLSSNDYTTAEKNKLAGLSNYDDTAVTNAMVRADTPDSDGFSQLYKLDAQGNRTDVYPAGTAGALKWIVPKIPSEASNTDDVFISANDYNSANPIISTNYSLIGNVIVLNNNNFYLWVKNITFGITSNEDFVSLFTLVVQVGQTFSGSNYVGYYGPFQTTSYTGYTVLQLPGKNLSKFKLLYG